MRRLECIQKRMESERMKLNLLEQRHGVLHPSVIRQSMKLDELINEYNKLESCTRKEPT
ncbi:aspartyl-phosphate phosphatase Spo0E family protein ['Paenibacillus yunnanensis' Narsing Rao et al. 2020]|uniref:aspartyl-phosphate phosphatase Spo0E family protein n=1 Tax=Paenibacillus tengchongensis TaxID=2608684 RepID=UPI00124D403B|nr:aspartyl-phosphate phosphatase Spo0E family protein [Paenibacillus tengchongensis]